MTNREVNKIAKRNLEYLERVDGVLTFKLCKGPLKDFEDFMEANGGRLEQFLCSECDEIHEAWLCEPNFRLVKESLNGLWLHGHMIPEEFRRWNTLFAMNAEFSGEGQSSVYTVLAGCVVYEDRILAKGLRFLSTAMN